MHQKQKSLFWKNKKLIYKNAGILTHVIGYEITQHAKNVKLGAFVVMPNHIHGILILTESNHLQSPIMVNLN
jgi:REP element-mobilizing transposase RayT